MLTTRTMKNTSQGDQREAIVVDEESARFADWKTIKQSPSAMMGRPTENL